MKKPPPDYDPDDDEGNNSRDEVDARTAKLNKRIATIFGCIIIGAILITIIALVMGK